MDKGLGIIRKVDELGRIVIPKEVRNAYGIKTGTPMEMFINENGDLIFKKYFSISDQLIEKINNSKQETMTKDKIIKIIKDTIGEW